jgi:hypothetical protein
MNWHTLLDLSSVIQATVVATGTATIQATAAATTAATAAVTTAATAVAGAVTATAGVQITPSETAVIVTPPTVVPTTATPPGPFSGDYFSQPADPAIGLASGAFLILSLILLGGGLYFYFLGKERWRKTHTLNYRTANLWSIISSAVGILGVLFVLFRFAGVLNERYWLYIILVVMLAVAIYAVYYFTRSYPKQLAAWTKRQAPKGSKATARVRTASTAPAARQGAKTPPPDDNGPTRPPGSPGNPRGTSPRGERRRAKR